MKFRRDLFLCLFAPVVACGRSLPASEPPIASVYIAPVVAGSVDPDDESFAEPDRLGEDERHPEILCGVPAGWTVCETSDPDAAIRLCRETDGAWLDVVPVQDGSIDEVAMQINGALMRQFDCHVTFAHISADANGVRLFIPSEGCRDGGRVEAAAVKLGEGVFGVRSWWPKPTEEDYDIFRDFVYSLYVIEPTATD